MTDGEVKVIADFIDWFLNQDACGVDIDRTCLLVGKDGMFEDALEVYISEVE